MVIYCIYSLKKVTNKHLKYKTCFKVLITFPAAVLFIPGLYGNTEVGLYCDVLCCNLHLLESGLEPSCLLSELEKFIMVVLEFTLSLFIHGVKLMMFSMNLAPSECAYYFNGTPRGEESPRIP